MVGLIRTYSCRLAGLQYLFRQQYSKICNTENNYFVHGDFLVLMKILKQ